MVKDFFYFIKEMREDIEFKANHLLGYTLIFDWYFYDTESEIIISCSTEPVNEDCLFYFNPKKCEFGCNGKKETYDVNDPICLISLNNKTDEVKLFTKDTLKYLQELGYTEGGDLERHERPIQEIFDKYDDFRFLLIRGNKVIATTFDFI
jgi:hypothetical protein